MAFRQRDLVATLVAGSVNAIAAAWTGMQSLGEAQRGRLLVGGGGARNSFVMSSLADALPGVRVETMDAAGVPADAAEAMAFSLC